MFKLTSLNLNGIRSAASKGLQDWVAQSMPDCICVQELKAQAADMSGRFEEIAGLKGHFHFAEKKGYSGVGVYTRHEPSDVIVGYGSTEFDAEGRYIELRFDRPGRKQSPKLSIISCYFPSGSSGEERQAAKFRFLDLIYPHLMALKAEREFILVGDINIAHKEIDLKNWKGNQKNSGFLPEEREWLGKVLSETGYVDVVRTLHPDVEGPYSWWSFRGKAFDNDSGWRIDYHMATPGLAARATSAVTERADSYTGRWSDHAPVTVAFDWDIAAVPAPRSPIGSFDAEKLTEVSADTSALA
jgi:exodeoxyribonuclease III